MTGQDAADSVERWMIAGSAGLTIRTWGDDEALSVVYAGEQRTTHLIDELSEAVLRQLAAGPRRADELSRLLDSRFEPPAGESGLSESVIRALCALESAELVCRSH